MTDLAVLAVGFGVIPLASILLLSCGLGVFYWLVVRHAFEEDNAVLADKAVALLGDLQNIDGPKLIDAEVHARRAGEHVHRVVRELIRQKRERQLRAILRPNERFGAVRVPPPPPRSFGDRAPAAAKGRVPQGRSAAPPPPG